MSATVAQHLKLAQTTQSATWTLSGVTTGAGNPLVAFISMTNNHGINFAVSTITDSAGNSWSHVGTLAQTGPGNNTFDVWQTTNASPAGMSGGSISLTFSPGATTLGGIVHFFELSGTVASGGPCDAGGSIATNTNASSPQWTSPSVSPGAAGELWLGCFAGLGYPAGSITLSAVTFHPAGAPSVGYPSLTTVDGGGTAITPTTMNTAQLAIAGSAAQQYQGNYSGGGGSGDSYFGAIVSIKSAPVTGDFFMVL